MHVNPLDLNVYLDKQVAVAYYHYIDHLLSYTGHLYVLYFWDQASSFKVRTRK